MRSAALVSLSLLSPLALIAACAADAPPPARTDPVTLTLRTDSVGVAPKVERHDGPEDQILGPIDGELTRAIRADGATTTDPARALLAAASEVPLPDGTTVAVARAGDQLTVTGTTIYGVTTAKRAGAHLEVALAGGNLTIDLVGADPATTERALGAMWVRLLRAEDLTTEPCAECIYGFSLKEPLCDVFMAGLDVGLRSYAGYIDENGCWGTPLTSDLLAAGEAEAKAECASMWIPFDSICRGWQGFVFETVGGPLLTDTTCKSQVRQNCLDALPF